MIEKLFIIFIVIEAIGVIHNITESVINTISNRKLTKTQEDAIEDAIEGQQRAIKIQDEQLKLSKFYSEKQDEQNENIKHLAWLIAVQDERLKEVEKRLRMENKETK